MTRLPGFVNAIKRPFQNLSTLGMGIILMMIPIINILVLGYFIQCAKSALRRNYKMPIWANWGNLFIKGIVTIIIVIIYMIPVWIVASLTMWTILIGVLSSMSTAGTFTAMNILAPLSTGAIGIVVTVILGVIFLLLASAAVVRYAEKEKFGAAFEVGAVARKAFTGTFFGMWILTVIYAFVVSAVASLIFSPIPAVGSYIGMSVASFITGVTVWTVLAEAYARR